ncbi:unnamed protein product [Malus baccata var. baccata]
MESSAGPELPSQVTCFEILPRLPSKSLMRFKCVCKSWSSLTCNPSFVNMPIKTWSISLPHTSPASCTAHVTHHFGYSPLTNEYKVLQVQKHIPAVGDVHFMFKVFKMGTSLWRPIEVDLNDISFDPLKFPFHRRSVCVNGTIHWMHGTHNPIVVFDIGDEKFRVIPLPEDYTCFTHLVRYPVGNIVGVGGYLGLIGDRSMMKNEIMGLWILKDYEKQNWSGYAVPFCIIHTDELLLQSAGLSRQNPAYMKVILYNMNNESLRRSDIIFPDKWAYLTGTRFKLLTSYEESIEPLIR